MKVKNLFHIFKVKAESGLDKLISAETKLDVALHDNLEALDQQKENAKKIFTAKKEFETELEKVKKDVSRYKTKCEVLKNKGLTKDDADMRIAVTQYLENKSVLEELENQKREIDATSERVENSLKKLNLNKSLIETKATALKTKIKFYKISENITETGLIDIDNVFDDISNMVAKMQNEREASDYVESVINGNESLESGSTSDSEIDDFIDSL